MLLRASFFSLVISGLGLIGCGDDAGPGGSDGGPPPDGEVADGTPPRPDTGPPPDGAMPPFVPVEHLIERLEDNAKFQGLDAATRATVLEALRESAPMPFQVKLDGDLPPGIPGERAIVLHLREDRDSDAD